jgi:hypothetical protein
MCEIDKNNRIALDQSPWLIDFALSTHVGIPFYDLAYLEMDILLRRMDSRRDHLEDWENWRIMADFLTSAVHPENAPERESLERIWRLIEPIRAYAQKLIERAGNKDLMAQFERAFWLAAMAAGVMVTRRSRMEPPEKHKASLFYSACALDKVLSTFGMRPPSVNPFPISWEVPLLTEEDIRAYYEGAKKAIIEDYRSEFTNLEKWVVPLAGVETPHAGEHPHPYPPLSEDIDPDMLEAMGLVNTQGKILAAGKPDIDLPKALEDSDPVDDVPKRLLERPRVVLIGEPGAGKTVTLEHLMLGHIKARQTNPSHPIPVLVPLSRFDGKTDFASYARSYLLNLKDHAENLPLVWLLDALNEMPNMGTRTGETKARRLLDEVVEFLQNELKAGETHKFERRFVLSCRIDDYKDELRRISRLDKVVLHPLNPELIQKIIQNRLRGRVEPRPEALWREIKGSDGLLRAYHAFNKAGLEEKFWTDEATSIPDEVIQTYIQGADTDTREAFKKRQNSGKRLNWSDYPAPFAEDMTARKEMLEDKRELLKLARNPFDLQLLIALAMIQGGADRLPNNRAGLLIEQAESRLKYELKEGEKRKDSTWNDKTIPRIKSVLMRVAEAIQRTEQRTEIPLKEALEAAAETDAHDLLNKAARATLIQIRETVRFQHQLWQEYFAALSLMESIQRDEDLSWYFAGAWWDYGAWRESLKLLVQVSQDQALDLDTVVQRLGSYSPEAALDLYRDFGPAEGRSGAGMHPATHDVLLKSAQQKSEYDFEKQCWREPLGDPRGRAAAWRVLGRLPAPARSDGR